MALSKSSIGATILFFLLLTLLHLIKPEIDPTWRFISEYAIGKNGWIMSLAFFAWASAFLFLFLSLHRQLKNVWGKIGIVCLLISFAGLVLSAIFISDPITDQTPSTTGELHNIGGTLCMAMPLSALFICISIFKYPLWASAKKQILWATIFALLGFIVSAGSLGYMFSQDNAKPGPEMFVGLPTRFEIITYCVWLITLARQTFKVTHN